MTIGHGNWNGCHFGTSSCFGDAAGMLWWRHCCRAAIIAAALLLLLGAKQGQDVYLAGQLVPSLLSYACADTNHSCCRYVCRLLWACECQCRADCCIKLIAMATY